MKVSAPRAGRMVDVDEVVAGHGAAEIIPLAFFWEKLGKGNRVDGVIQTMRMSVQDLSSGHVQSLLDLHVIQQGSL